MNPSTEDIRDEHILEASIEVWNLMAAFTHKATATTLLLGESSLILCSFLAYCSSVKECQTAVDIVSKPFNINHVTYWEIFV